MKKILSLVLILSMFSALQAQVEQLKPQPRLNQVVEKAQVGNMDPMVFSNEINPTTANDRAADVVIGETFYDLQSNSTMMQRFWIFDDGTMGAVWTRGMTPTAYADRGTGYNYFDGTSWGALPTERIEEVKTGWPSYAPYGANGEIVCAHTFTDAGLVFSWRENKGEGDWNYFSLVGPPGHEGIAWPRMITSGENNEIIHVIASVKSTVNGGSPYMGLDGALSYSRSSDGGQTWDPDNIILDGLSSDYFASLNADSYAWAKPQGNTLAFVYFGGITDGVVMKSEDGGDNWERILFYESPLPFFTGEEGNLPKCGGGDSYNAVVIDDEGLVHVAFGRQIHVDEDPAAGWNYYPYSDGLVYWNETMPTLDTTKITADIIPDDWESHYLYQNGNLAAWVQPNGNDTIVGIAYYGASMTSMPQLSFYRNGNGEKIIHVNYSAISVGYDNSELNYRHIWERFTEGDGKFSAFTDYTGDVFHIFSECVYPSVSQNIPNEKISLIYQSDNMPGTSIQPDPPVHDPVLNSIVYLPVGPFMPVGNEEIGISAPDVTQNYPNPFQGSSWFEITLHETANVNLEVFSLTGQKVMVSDFGYKAAGKHTLSIDAAALTNGIYFYTVTAGQYKSTHKMMIR
ncbi:MAG: T9SS type A sorting domain-containing protein [Bacteroidetes bacterium]|nr:T9SS type A sorting domain-containing protein [Bacteroidota bacterium]